MDLVNIEDWASTEDQIIEVSQVFLKAPYKLRVRQFIPQEGDMLEEIWHDGYIQRRFPIPPYAIVDMEEAAQSIAKMAEATQHLYWGSIIPQNSKSEGGDFIWDTFLFAFKYIGDVKVCSSVSWF